MTTPTPKFYAMEKTADNETTVTLYDEIGAFSAGSKEFLADLGKLSGQHIHLRINSPGGSVIEGTAIYNALRRHEGGLTVHIDAMAASMASVIAMAGKPVYMADNALLMIHNPWTVSMGESKDLRKEADLLDKLKVNLRNAYVRKTGMEADRITEMMDAETWLDAVEAVALGFADAIEEGVAAAATATPAQLRARFDTFAKAKSMDPETEKPEETEVANEPTPLLVEILASLDEVETKSADLDDESKVTLSERLQSMATAMSATEEETTEETTEEATKEDDEEYAADPQAKASAADAILAKYNEVIARAEAAESHAKAIESKLDLVKSELATKCEDLDRLERSLGLSPARIVPAVDQSQDSGSIYDQWKSASGADKTRIFRTHRKALEAHAKMHGI
jgi:ATP-dependent protease ClpP protease subunit